ncbi:Fanconi anemia group D2 protein [Tachyglossus aculeatus]|uniref:Fanconi anemia group D2 protein n=1 Tax=Tachyglossus aculeatus TaxID=9261 RepID=UPI0018F4F3B4|nr:Fanconi anemia group D2 protein [Tachyglossus aculeatus]
MFSLEDKEGSLPAAAASSRPSPSKGTEKNQGGDKSQKPNAGDGVVNDDTVFVQLLKAAGIFLKVGGKKNELVVEQVIFQKKLFQELKKHALYPRVIEEFVSGLESYIEDRDCFRSCLQACECFQIEETRLFTPCYKSVIKLLLGIDILQPAVIRLLFEKFPQFMLERPGSEEISIPQLIISQFKWIDKIIDGKDFNTKILQLISVVPVALQHDIITSLPEILEDCQRGDMAKELCILMKQNIALTVPVLDVMPSLYLGPEFLVELRQSLMTQLSVVKLEDLPVIVKFILHSITTTNALEVIAELRVKLSLESCVLPSEMQSLQKRKKQASSSRNQGDSSQDCIVLLCDVIKSALRFQKSMSEAWIKAIENIDSASDHKALDLVVLLIICSINPQSKKQIGKVLRNKVQSGYIQEPLLQRTFSGLPAVFRDYLPSLLSVAQILLRSVDHNVISFVSLLYKHAFLSFDAYCQQEVIGTLVNHVCCGTDTEVNISLDVLLELVVLNHSAMCLCSSFLKGILEYLDNLTLEQIRKLFTMLCRLAFSKGHEDSSHMQDELHMVIRKQLFSHVSKYKLIGVIGAVSMVGTLIERRIEASKVNPVEEKLTDETKEQVTSLLELICSCSENSPQASVLYYDEFANLVHKGNLASQTVEWIEQTMLNAFQDAFVVDHNPAQEGADQSPVKALYQLEEESEGEIAINLLPLLAQQDLKKNIWDWTPTDPEKKMVSPVCLPPFFRLLRICVQRQNAGKLDDIEGLLVCPLYFSDLESQETLASMLQEERSFKCSLLFLAINWFRELVNAFCGQIDPDIKEKLIARLKHIIELQTVLEKYLAVTPRYEPPVANFDFESLDGIPHVKPAVLGKTRKNAGPGGRKRKADGSKISSPEKLGKEVSREGDQSQNVKSQLKKDPKKEKLPLVSLQNYNTFFRELDLEVFSVLHCRLWTPSPLAAEFLSVDPELNQLEPPHLLFLLDDLFRKMENSLPPLAKRSPFLTSKRSKNVGFSHLQQKSTDEIARCFLQLLTPLSNHMEVIHNYFQVLIDEDKDMEDVLSVHGQAQQVLASCYLRLLQIFHGLFAWNGFSQPKNENLLKSALEVLAGKLYQGDSELPEEELFSLTFRYLRNFQPSIPTFQCGLYLIKLQVAIAEKSPGRQHKDKIASQAKMFLCKVWLKPNGEKEKGSGFNDQLQSLLSIYLTHTDNILKAIEEIVMVGVEQLTNSPKEAHSSIFPTLSRQTFLVYFRVMMIELEKTVRTFPANVPTDIQELREKFVFWKMAVKDFHILISLVKVYDSWPILNVSLKYGRLFVDGFLKQCMPLLDSTFKKYWEEVDYLLKIFQLSTRQLHNMCSHSKIHQDVRLTSHVPSLKKSLEMLVLRVKAMLILNNCQEAFWLGILRNRDLQGEEILEPDSQEEESEMESVSQLSRQEAEKDNGNKASGSESD